MVHLYPSHLSCYPTSPSYRRKNIWQKIKKRNLRNHLKTSIVDFEEKGAENYKVKYIFKGNDISQQSYANQIAKQQLWFSYFFMPFCLLVWCLSSSLSISPFCFIYSLCRQLSKPHLVSTKINYSVNGWILGIHLASKCLSVLSTCYLFIQFVSFFFLSNTHQLPNPLTEKRRK